MESQAKGLPRIHYGFGWNTCPFLECFPLYYIRLPEECVDLMLCKVMLLKLEYTHTWITQESCQNAAFDSIDQEWGPRICISDRLPGGAMLIGTWHARGVQGFKLLPTVTLFQKVIKWPPTVKSCCLRVGDWYCKGRYPFFPFGFWELASLFQKTVERDVVNPVFWWLSGEEVEEWGKRKTNRY